ncbi:MAG: hypothetical protein A3A98_02995 [Candidatus Staskawiczbacteria bacterium RIFCSPLOWO2_01_FULL_40_39]|uniref:Uncharacterized protein n=1 Tax=Candidatus Staskawiczbacteria bacterium RIFCSPHIGHO2_01_FULL_39_25 TaxID=1802202 RepID=A0A1G2HQD3_9BACT|nr:MAG: hypothetical protein A2730_01460 [Candidatus Staskawiczbacteria bacterium RIFCSPHIGHO2_01_FULL_39_25]OGZ73854.1 MAG: hypothetical protein A3A98_02995 [Candidatus Staskawiczbacteria bacterium RIFCSPLOWO2_01_FULL_40_39]OGZ75892.1 MAG: hypothetical protein A3I87_00025 [Candidatus Staskawiczbacteria bacterium RIFCSPLOWO2_02_FULL_39_8]
MQFEIKNINKSINDLMRTIGYMPAYFQNDGEFSIIKKIGRNDYPRFHLYIVQNSQSFIFKLHLDQKKPSYEGSTGHSGDYDGPVVESEAERIQQLLSQNQTP